MDSTRISIARVLALDVPLSWQDAVAVAQEAAMLSDVNAAMNSRPSLVSAEACFISKTGDVDLPETADHESADAIADLLREMLAGRDAPEGVEAIAYGQHSRDMNGELARFPVGNRRAVIAKLAMRAFAALDAPPTADFEAPPSASLPPPSFAATAPAFDQAALPLPRPVLVAPRPQRPPFVAAASDARPAAPPPSPFAATPPFVARPAAPPVPPAPAEPVTPPASDAELQRLRRRSVERDRGQGHWAGAFSRLVPWIVWRPEHADPRVLGGAAVIIAAIVSVVWRGGPSPTGETRPRPSTSATASAAPTAPNASPVATSLAVRPPSATTAATSNASVPPPTATTPPAMSAAPRRRARNADEGAALDTPADDTATTAAAAMERMRVPAAYDAPASTSASSPAASSIVVPAVDAPPAEPVRRSSPSTAPTSLPRSAASRRPLYSARDADVVAPVMLRQQLPSSVIEPDAAAPADWPYMEVVVDERGAVEQVRLHAPSLAPGQTLYRHRMLLAAAKAWQFEPATRDGAPVRYLMRVPLEP